jgi:hypothetical protein
VLEFDGVLRAYPPAIRTPDTTSHVVQKSPFPSGIIPAQCISGTILNTCQASVAIIIYDKIRHRFLSPAVVRYHSPGTSLPWSRTGFIQFLPTSGRG